MTALQNILEEYRASSQTEREKGTYFEELIRTYFRYEASYTDLYSDVWLFADWAREIGTPQFGISAKDTGIDLVAKTNGTKEFHAIQCKNFASDYRVRKEDIDSFFTASGKKPFTQRIIVTTTNDWSENAENALSNQQPPVYKIDLHALENSQIDWSKYKPSAAPALKPKYDIDAQRSRHQKSALTNVVLGFKSADRGKLIMACGTGKTFTSLKIAEQIAGKNKIVLFLVPSLNLLSQTLTEWTQHSTTLLHSFAVCSDAEVGKKRNKEADIVETFAHELRYPATTDAKRLAEEVKKRHDAQHMSVIFCTYHSLQVISEAQQQFGLPEIYLVICDEAHRTTGVTFENEEESTFVKIHNNDYVRAAKRLYMTATPRIYGELAKATAERENAELCSMNDETIYGKQFHVITFSEAVGLGLLTDYKVVVLTIDEAHISARLQNLLKDDNNQLKVDDAARIIGCWKALAKQGLAQDASHDPDPMRRAVAFCQVIEIQKGGTKHKVSSKQIATMFQTVVDAYQVQEDSDVTLKCEAAHVDGSMNASQKEEKLDWLKAPSPENTCRILSNVRCLSEGVDVPALDAVLFLTPRNSQVDVVQSVGRVMRTTMDGKKKLGYVILPVVIPAGMDPKIALDDNKVYRVVWEVLQALRSHDDRFDAFVNKLDLIGHDPRRMEVVAITNNIGKKQTKTKGATKGKTGQGQFTIGTPEDIPPVEVQSNLAFNVGEIERALYAKVVKKCGNRNHWEDWANDIAKIANTHITRITQIVSDPANTKEVAAFKGFADELRDDLNNSITDGEVIEMLAQHLITKPVFDALFKDYSFASNNPVSQAMQQVLNILQEHRLEKETDTLDKFYSSVAMRAEGIENAKGKQKIVVELYDKFFKSAFPKMTKRLGIVYTPVEVVDFIIHSINDLLQQEFGLTLGSEGVHILDPFTGTATFITRLIQSGLISKEHLPHKYKHEIHANEIVLLAYYIAAINIEAVYHSIVGGKYEPFEGICLTDTFQLYEKGDLISNLLANNSDRRKRQKSLEVRVIMGNPPYSDGQDSANDDAANIEYPDLDKRISETYIDNSQGKGGKRSAYNSYIRAIRWASDRIGRSGVIGFVSGSGYIEKPALDGIRKSLTDEFSSIYIFNLRGDIRKNMLSRGLAKEGENIFGSGSMTGITITLFVKNRITKDACRIHYHNIGDDLNESDKLKRISGFKSINGVAINNGWSQITPNEQNDWLNQRDANLIGDLLIGSKKKPSEVTLFLAFSNGLVSNRDKWVFNYSKTSLSGNCEGMTNFYNCEIDRYKTYTETTDSQLVDVQAFVQKDTTKISWGGGNWQAKFGQFRKEQFEPEAIRKALYRPFTKTWHYGAKTFNHSFYTIPRIFPNVSAANIVICVSGVGARSGFSALISDSIPSLDTIEKSQCFPLYLYDKTSAQAEDELPSLSQIGSKETYSRQDAISEAGLNHFKVAYPGETITKEDLFYYVYGLLHSPDYRTRYADNLSKELPRIPAVKSFADFQAFSKAGRNLAHWHLDYETVDCFSGATLDTGKKPVSQLTPDDYRVTKMRFAKIKDSTGKSVADKTTVIYNERITIHNIPLVAYDYVVNGKPALEWVMERQTVSTDDGDGGSGIVNDANLWATETMGNAKYPLELFLRVITVSLETMRIVNSLPKLVAV